MITRTAQQLQAERQEYQTTLLCSIFGHNVRTVVFNGSTDARPTVEVKKCAHCDYRESVDIKEGSHV